MTEEELKTKELIKGAQKEIRFHLWEQSGLEQLAKERGWTFSGAVRYLVQIGLEGFIKNNKIKNFKMKGISA